MIEGRGADALKFEFFYKNLSTACAQDLFLFFCLFVFLAPGEHSQLFKKNQLLFYFIFLRWLGRQVGNEGGDGTDVGDDPKHDGEHGKPQGLAGRRVGPLEVPLG